MLLKLKFFIKEILWLGLINKWLYGPKKKRLNMAEMGKPHNGVKIYEVIPENQSKLIIDPELLKLSNVSEIKEYSADFTITPVYIADISVGRLLTDCTDVAIMTSDRLLLEHFSVHYKTGMSSKGAFRTFGSQTQEQNNVYNLRYYYPPKKIKGTVYNMQTGGGGGNYCHFLFDILPGYYLAEKAGLIDSIDYIYFPTKGKNFHKEIFKALNLSENKIITNENTCHFIADRLISFTHPNNLFHPPMWIFDFLRGAFLTKIIPDKEKYSKIFISRKDSAYGRQISNEDELLKKLEPLGFKRIILSEQTFLDQVKIFNSADLIISAHGAGLANLAFCMPGTSVIEIFNQDFITPLFHCICKRLNINHSFIITEDNNNMGNRKDAGYTNIFIDEKVLFEKLQQLKN
jgi:hypothetical protein